MKFSIKMFITTLVVVSIVFCLGGTLLIMQNFNYSLHRQVGHSAAEHHTLKYFYDARLSGEIWEGKELTHTLLTQSADYVAEHFSWNGLVLCISNSEKNHVFSNLPQGIGRLDVMDTLLENPHYKIVKNQDRYYVIMSSASDLRDTRYYITSAADITAVYTELAHQVSNMIITHVVLLIVLSVILFVLSSVITRPIRTLSQAAGRVASGHYGERVEVRGDDEVTLLSEQFNQMADSVEQNILRLETYAKSRDDFVANFSHEMKTPMTAIIGYADLLRSAKCMDVCMLRR
jgi:signal transduction histidine kinase